MIRNVVLNQFLVILPGLFLMDFAANYVRSLNVLPWSPGIRISNELPELPEVLVKSVLSVLLVEVNFYVSHRLLHVPWLYARIHKIHHAYKAPHAFAAIYAHPIEALVGNTFAVMGPAFFLGFHLSHWMLGVVVGWLSTMTSHSGYKMPFPFARLLSTPHFHDLHHEVKKNKHLSSFFFSDSVYVCVLVLQLQLWNVGIFGLFVRNENGKSSKEQTNDDCC